MIKVIKKRVEELSRVKSTTLVTFSFSIGENNLILKLSEFEKEIESLKKLYSFHICKIHVGNWNTIHLKLQLKFLHTSLDIR